MSTPALSLRGVVLPGVDGVLSFDVGAGECVAIIDPRPQRTALLEAIATTVSPSAEHADRLTVSALWIQDGMPEDVAIGQTVRTRLAALGSQLEAETLLGDLGLAHRADHEPWAMSVGERRRIAAAVALAGPAAVVLLDEPERGLDRTAIRLLAQRIRRGCDNGTVVVLTTNDAGLAEECGDYVVQDLQDIAQ